MISLGTGSCNNVVYGTGLSLHVESFQKKRGGPREGDRRVVVRACEMRQLLDGPSAKGALAAARRRLWR